METVAASDLMEGPLVQPICNRTAWYALSHAGTKGDGVGLDRMLDMTEWDRLGLVRTEAV